jgi:glycine cleavage system H protein
MTSLNHPANLKYSKTDEWVRVEGDNATVGISDYAQDQLGDIVYVELTCPEGQNLAHKAHFGDIESVKATSELISPLSGEVVKINAALRDHPELINDDPYNEGWMYVVKMANPAELNDLMSVDQYLQYIQSR